MELDEALSVVGTGAFWVLLGMGLDKLFFLIAQAGIARFFGPDIYGVVSIGVTVHMILAIVGRVGLDTGLRRFLPSIDAARREEVISSCFTYTMVASSVLTALAVGALFVFEVGSSSMTLLVGLVFLTPLLSLSILLLRAIEAFNTYRYRFWIEGILFGVVLVTGIVIAGVMDNVVVVVAAFAAAHGAQLLAGVWNVPYRVRFNATLDMDLLSYSWPLSFHESLRILSRYVTLFIIGILLSGADVGLYSSALNIAVLLSVFLVITQPSFFTTATHMDDLSSLFRTVTKALLVLTIPLFVVGVLHADDLLWIVFGSAFVEATPVLVVLLCALGFEVFTGPVERYLNTKGYSKHVMVNMVVSTVVTVLGSVALIPGYGIVGAAVANAVAIVIQRVLGLVEAYVLTGLVPYTSEAVSVAAAGSVLAVGTTLASYSSIVVEAVVFLTLLAGYLCSVWLVALTTEERSWLRSLTETFLT